MSLISFGRTVKINASRPVARQVAEVVNNGKNANASKRAKNILREVFYDVNQGRAQVFTTGKDTFVLTGEESKQATLYKKDMKRTINAAKNTYHDDVISEVIKNEEQDRYKDLMKMLVYDTESSISLDVNCDSRSGKVRSVDVVV